MKRKFPYIVAAVLLLALMLTGCGNERVPPESAAQKGIVASKDPHAYKIGFSNCGQNHPLFSEIQRYFEDAAGKQSNWEIVLTEANNTSEQQVMDVETLIAQNCDAVVLIPNDSSALSAAVKKLNEAKIPVITLVRAVDEGQTLCNIGCDDYEIGRIAANYIATKMDGNGTVLNLEGTPGASTAILRSQGFQDVMAEYPEIHIISGYSANYQRTKALQIATGILQSKIEFDAVWATNDEQCGGVSQALQNAGITNKILVGCNWQRDGYERVIDGTQSADITYPPEMGATASNKLTWIYNDEDDSYFRNIMLEIEEKYN